MNQAPDDPASGTGLPRLLLAVPESFEGWPGLSNALSVTYGAHFTVPSRAGLRSYSLVLDLPQSSLPRLLADAERGQLDAMVATLGARFVQEISLGSECVYNHAPTTVLEPQPPYEDVSTAELKTLLQRHKVQVLLLTSTETERKALHLRMAPLAGRKGLVEGAIHHVTYRLGQLGRYPVAHVESTAGSQARHGAALTIQDAINELEPKIVLAVGIAFGLDPKKQRLGDVIVAESVMPYELQRVDMKVTHRAQPILCGSLLSERFRTRRADWRLARGEESVNVFQGEMLSGEKLVDNPEFRGRLIEAFPQAVAGEMEGAGLYAATARQGVEVLLVKALCDWGDGSKTNRAQVFAAKAAVSLVEHVLNKKDVLAPLVVDEMEIKQRADHLPTSADSEYWLHDASGHRKQVIKYLNGKLETWNVVTEPPGIAPGHSSAPQYPDDETRQLSLQMEKAQERKRRLQDAGESTAQVDREILELRRQLRQGGQLRAGDSLGDGRYLLIESIGQGGFARIWKATDRVRRETVAIKVLHANLAGDARRRERFFRGARLMAELEHPAVVKVLEPRGVDEGYHFFVMEYVSGGNLREAVLRKTLTQEQFLSVVLRIGEALTLGHSRGIIHRDVKPANILLNSQGQPLLTDFDLVGAADTTGGTATGAMGTFLYAAPECLERPQDADQRADIYSLGMTAIFGLHGADLPLQILRDPESFISRLACPAPLKKVLSRAIGLVPGDRYQNVGEFLTAMQQAPNSVIAAPVPSAIAAPVLPIVARGDRHSWSEADDLIAFYLYRFGTALLPFDLRTIAERRGIKPGSMMMRISNFKAYAGTGKLGNIARQSVEVFERYRDTPEPELRNRAFPELAR